jgi:hypothetical protein
MATTCLAALWAGVAVPCAAVGPGLAADIASAAPSDPTTDPLDLAARSPSLPDAPQVQLAEAPAAVAQSPQAGFSLVRRESVASPGAGAPAPKLTTGELDAACQSGKLRGRPCKLVWLPMLWEAFEATAVENAGNIAFDSDTRNALTNNPYIATWFKCVHQYRYRQWSDDTPFIVHDIGHPMQGASVYSIYAQNDPKSRGLIFANNGNYWRGKFKAMAFVTLFEIQWKIGPASEAAIGNSGLNTYPVPGTTTGRTTNETGFQDFVITPVYGLGWNIAEDLVDRFVMPHIWKRTHNRLILTALLPLTPCRDAANILRYKPFYYRDYPITPLR